VTRKKSTRHQYDHVNLRGELIVEALHNGDNVGEQNLSAFDDEMHKKVSCDFGTKRPALLEKKRKKQESAGILFNNKQEGYPSPLCMKTKLMCSKGTPVLPLPPTTS
jgi:hypothetical protein